jgi:YD repeat-containing protein
MAYDAAGRSQQTTDALQGGRRSVYDLAGQLTAERDELGRWTRYEYNTRGWQTKTTDALGNVVTTTYDAAGNQTAVTDPLNHTVTYSYDALNRQTETIDPLGNRTTTTYDAAGNVATVKDPLNHTDTYVHSGRATTKEKKEDDRRLLWPNGSEPGHLKPRPDLGQFASRPLGRLFFRPDFPRNRSGQRFR